VKDSTLNQARVTVSKLILGTAPWDLVFEGAKSCLRRTLVVAESPVLFTYALYIYGRLSERLQIRCAETGEYPRPWIESA
jgi:hypothetical protein